MIPEAPKTVEPSSPTKPGTPVKVLVVDDSYLWSTTVAGVLAEDPEIEVVASASNGREAIQVTQELRPDLVIMDIVMPVVGGLEAISTIMAQSPTPILAMSAVDGHKAGHLTFESLRRGALDLMVKDTTYPPPPEFVRALRSKVKELAAVQVVRHLHPGRVWREPVHLAPVRPSRRVRVVAIVASTGGPVALATILQGLRSDFAAGVLVVQHLMGGFAPVLAGWLDEMTSLTVRVAVTGDSVVPGEVLIAPDDRHLVVDAEGRVSVTQDPPEGGNRPSGDRLLKSVARHYGAHALGLILSGMGKDGSEGLAAVRSAGAKTFAQDEASSVVFGMPAAAAAAEAVEQFLPLAEIAAVLNRIVF